MTSIKGKSVLVTGGCGFIGTHVARRYMTEGATVAVLDDFSSPHAKEVPGTTLFKGDVQDAKLVAEAMEGVHIVSHQAAVLNMFEGIHDKTRELNVNVVGTINLLDAAVKAGVEKFVYASSCGMYGNSRYLPQDEEHPKNPAWPYGITKYAAEMYCQLYTRLHGLPTVSLRYSEVYGPGEWYGRVLTLFIKRVSQGKPPVVFGGGRLLRDYVYIDDVVEANILATLNDEASGMAFNIGGTPLDAARIAGIVASIINPAIQPVHDDPEPGMSSVHQPGRPRLVQELNDFVLDSTLAKDKLGWVPKTPINDGIKKEIDWFKENPSAWEVVPRV